MLKISIQKLTTMITEDSLIIYPEKGNITVVSSWSSYPFSHKTVLGFI